MTMTPELREVLSRLVLGGHKSTEHAPDWAAAARRVARASEPELIAWLRELHAAAERAEGLAERLAAAERAPAERLPPIDLLQELTRATRDRQDLEGCLAVCVETIGRRLGWPVGHAWIQPPGEPGPARAVAWQADAAALAGRTIDSGRLHEALVGAAPPVEPLSAGSDAPTPELVDLPRATEPRYRAALEAGFASALTIPLQVNDDVALRLEFFHPVRQPRDPALLALATTLGAQAAEVLARHRADQELATQMGLLNATLHSSPEGILVIDREGKVIMRNERFATLWRVPADLLASGDDERLLGFVLEQLKDPAAFIQRIQELYRDETQTATEEIEFLDGRVFQRYTQPVRARGQAIGRIWVFQDITAQRQAERRREILEEQLRQTQKMEAIGMLAGGVAHDFNNLLTVISGNGQYALSRLTPGDAARGNIEEIVAAAERAGSLTRQLLAFSRQQVMAPAVLNLNEVVVGLGKMLQRLVGEEIEMVLALDDDLGRVRADPGQVEQILLNLVINARDAMPGGGRVTIATRNLSVSPEEAARNPAFAAGEWVSVAVTDTGEGIAAAALPRIFEPFFTTKELGKGTGLGLAMVYGTVTQSGGHIAVESKPGQGASFRFAFPRVFEPLDAVPAPEPGRRGGGSETILLVEDDEMVHSLVRDTLQDRGYHVLSAADGVDALATCQRHAGPIHLILTDVIMPRMSGRELYERLRPLYPEMRVLFMSGYSRDTASGKELIPAGVAFLPKPFTLEALESRVRDVLDESRSSTA